MGWSGLSGLEWVRVGWTGWSELEWVVAKILILRACSHEPGTVNYPGAMIAPGQALPRVHMMVCCPGATLPRVNFIAPGQVHRHHYEII